ncbi:transposase, partial [Paucisalibacillus globulus]|uniref:transposase n=1 Tax=Paucisalibacillus globulus TaxID=351095 RepID=UPI001143ECF2
TNTIERTIKEVKKRTKTMNSLPNEKAVEKIVYLVSQDFNERWGKRVINEFSSVKSELKKMFEARYND